jgi:general secretion pathway protein N
VRIAIAGAIAFLIILLTQFPAQWAAGALPTRVRCTQIDGTLWNGACVGLTAQGVALGDLTWSLHPLRLFLGKLSLDVTLSRAAGNARGLIEIGPTGAITARNVHASWPLDHSVVGALPPNLHASAQADLASLHWDGHRISAIQGDVDLRGLEQARGSPLGDYRLSFPGGAGDEPVGNLRDLGGPLAVDGTLRLTREPGFVLDARIAARPNASPEIVKQLQYLGSPDAQGRRPLSVAGTF